MDRRLRLPEVNLKVDRALLFCDRLYIALAMSKLKGPAVSPSCLLMPCDTSKMNILPWAPATLGFGHCGKQGTCSVLLGRLKQRDNARHTAPC